LGRHPVTASDIKKKKRGPRVEFISFDGKEGRTLLLRCDELTLQKKFEALACGGSHADTLSGTKRKKIDWGETGEI
jgi:hypothetical protein